MAKGLSLGVARDPKAPNDTLIALLCASQIDDDTAAQILAHCSGRCCAVCWWVLVVLFVRRFMSFRSCGVQYRGDDGPVPQPLFLRLLTPIGLSPRPVHNGVAAEVSLHRAYAQNWRRCEYAPVCVFVCA